MTPLMTQTCCPVCGGPPDSGMTDHGLSLCNGCISRALAEGFRRQAERSRHYPVPQLPVGRCPACGATGEGYADQADPMGMADAEGLCPCRRRVN